MRTCFDRIRQVPPGCSLELRMARNGRTMDQPRIRAFATRRRPPPEFETHPASERAVTQCSHLIRRAVEKRIEHSEVEPIVLAWSGGVDSTILAAILHADYRDRIETMTVYDESLLADPEHSPRLAVDLGLRNQSYKIELSEFASEFPRAVSENPGAQPGYSAYFIGLAARRLYPTAKVILCGEGADEFFLGYSCFVRPEGLQQRMMESLQSQAPKLVACSPLLRKVRGWKRRGRDERWKELVDIEQTHQLASNHLIAFDHGCMAHSLECRVPFLDRDLLDYAGEIPDELKVLEGIPKIHLRRVLEHLLAGTRVAPGEVLVRPKTPAFFATRACTSWLGGYVESRKDKDMLLRSPLLPFGDLADLFWIRSVEVVFLLHRGEVEGMTFEDLWHEAMNRHETA